jgi:aminoglycoside phosphotransferase (APT) family kinase protein
MISCQPDGASGGRRGSPIAGRDAFREALPTDDATWERARGWVIWQSVAALAYYTPKNNPSLYSSRLRPYLCND